MTQLSTIAMESCDLAAHAVAVRCSVCEGHNSFDVERCRHCQAPLALTYQVEGSRKTAPTMMVVLGPSGCGKTVYLGMLADMLSRQAGPCQMLARGAFSVEVQQQTIGELAHRRFPPRTDPDPKSWNWMHCQVAGSRWRRPSEFILPDMSGAAVEEEIERQASPIIRAFLKKCAAAIILVDSERLEGGDEAPDFFAMKVISHLHELGASRKTSWIKRPVAIVFTKADASSSCFDDPTAFAEVHAPGLWRQCQQRLKRHRFFAASVVAASCQIDLAGEPMPIAMRIEPHGIIQPMEWVIKSLGL